MPGYSEKYVTIATYIGAWEAHLARAKLESEGIYALVLDDQTASINWIYSSALCAVRLQVREEDSKRAIHLLETTAEEEPAILQKFSALDTTAPICPACGSSNISRARFSSPVAVLSFLLFGLPFLFIRKRFVCKNCGRKWRRTQGRF
ncbi:MAG: hypothetical protein ACLQDF_14930 [Desulfomonilia bacterium]